MIEFSQARLKLRVAICPFSASGSEFHHRVIGMKREGGSGGVLIGANQMILRQFLLLLPFECTFSDLKALVLAQYQKLYKNQPAYVQLKNILHFRDVNQCDLDLDYLVVDICASNDLIYVMVEIDDNSNSNINNNINNNNNNLNKKLKTSEYKNDVSNVKKNINNNLTASAKPVPVHKVIVSQTETKPNPFKLVITDISKNELDSKNAVKIEKKVPEFKLPTPIAVPTAKTYDVPIANTEIKYDANLASKTTPSYNNTIINVKEKEKHKPLVTPKLIQIPKQRIPETNIVIKPVDSKIEEAEKIQVGPVKINDELKIDSATDDNSNNLLNSVTTLAETSVLCTALSEDSVCNEDKKRSSTMITPSPTPIQRSSPIISRQIFNPRKIPHSPAGNKSNSSDSEESSDEEAILKSNFDASSLFGSQIIATEPRRSDAFVLFEAGSSGSSSDESVSVSASCNNVNASSIVSLQAEPSSELDNLDSSSDAENDLEINSNLPQSVTLRRLSSISPIPDPSEMPSLDELKESLNRAPTPVQILQSSNSDKNSKFQAKKKANHHYHHQQNNTQTQPQTQPQTHNHSHKGRPAKKAHRGRPKASL